MRGEWVVGVSMTLLTVVLCVALAIAATREAHRLSTLIGALAAAFSWFFASDLAVHLRLAGTDVSLNLVLLALAAFGTSLVIYLRHRATQMGSPPGVTPP